MKTVQGRVLSEMAMGRRFDRMSFLGNIFREIAFLRWIVALIGLGLIVVAVDGVVEGYRDTREFRRAVACGSGGGNCLGSEAVSIVDRRSYTKIVGYGHHHPIPRLQHEVTWERLDGSRQARDVSPGLYDKAGAGQSAEVTLWRGEVVGVAIAGETTRFMPESAETFRYRMYWALFGLGVLLFCWWDGFVLAGCTFGWMVLGYAPVVVLTDTLAYGLELGVGLGEQIVACVVLAVIGAAILLYSFSER